MKIGRLNLPRWALPYAAVALLPAVYVVLYQVSIPDEQAWDHTGHRAVLSARPAVQALAPLPEPTGLDQDKVALGRQLFMDPSLSKAGDISCASCHDLLAGGDDGLPFSQGTGDQMTSANSPTVFNAALNFVQFWDGRATSLEDQIDGPLSNPSEMGMSWPLLLRRLLENDAYQQAFNASYADGITAANVKNAIAEFERSLITPGASFDRYLRGDDTALSDQELRGYGLFRDYGCASCHQGRNIGGNLFQKLGIVRPFFTAGQDLTTADLGRFNVTGENADRHVFKVPSLRNVSETAPYFHDGSVATLEKAIALMGYHQLGRTLEPEEIDDIAAFLGTLTGELPASVQ